MRVNSRCCSSSSSAAAAAQSAWSLQQAKCLPGFRFSPTEQELVEFYLRKAADGKDELISNVITTIDLYKHDPWELPGLARMGEREWFFFVPKDKKYPNGSRPNRVTKSGYWKATGTDRPVMSSDENAGLCIGLKKTLVFYEGKAPRGAKTSWIMNEFRLTDADLEHVRSVLTLCRIYQKGTVRSLGAAHWYHAEEVKQEQVVNLNKVTTPLTTTSTATMTTMPSLKVECSENEAVSEDVDQAPPESNNVMFSGFVESQDKSLHQMSLQNDPNDPNASSAGDLRTKYAWFLTSLGLEEQDDYSTWPTTH